MNSNSLWGSGSIFDPWKQNNFSNQNTNPSQNMMYRNPMMSQADPYQGGSPSYATQGGSSAGPRPQQGFDLNSWNAQFNIPRSGAINPVGGYQNPYGGGGSMGQSSYRNEGVAPPGAPPAYHNPYGGAMGSSVGNPYNYDPVSGGPRPSNRGPADWNAVPKPGVVDPNYTPYGAPRPLSGNRWTSYGSPSYYQGGMP